MESLSIENPFPGAASFLVAETDSTMNEAKRLARMGFPPGTVVAAEFQTEGRGRFPERRWEAEKGQNLLFTLRLKAENATIPALPLRIGIALCQAVNILAIRGGSSFPIQPRIKWPNDLLFDGRKAAGILCESKDGNDGMAGVYIGVGVNCNQTAFGSGQEGATSLALELGRPIDRWALLELFLELLRIGLTDPGWMENLKELLWKRGERVRFVPGLPGSGLQGSIRSLEGLLEGVDREGSLVLRVDGESNSRTFPAGELSTA